MKFRPTLWMLALLAAVSTATVHYSTPPGGSSTDMASMSGTHSGGGGRGSSMPRGPARPQEPRVPQGPHNPAPPPRISPWTPTQEAGIDAMRRHVVGPSLGLQSVPSQGMRFDVPEGGWVTGWHRRFPGLRSCYLHPYRVPPFCVVGCGDFWTPYWGAGWYNDPYGFYWGSTFWFGVWSGPLDWADYAVVPLYVVSPISQVDEGELAQPPGGFQNDAQAEQAMLWMMASPSALDATAGLYDGTNSFDAAAPGLHLSAETAYGMLRQGLPVFYHPPNGAFERINNLTELHTYLYTPESHQAAPPQEPQRGTP